jgi:hypothetical protein
VLLELAEVRQQRVVVVRQGFRVRHQQRWWWVGLYAQVLEFCDSLEFRCAAARFQPTGFVGGLVFGGEFGIQFGIVFDIILRIEFVIVLRHRLIPKVVTILFLFPKTLTLALRLLWFGEGTHTGKHQLLIELAILQPIGKLVFGVRQVNPIINQIFELYLRFADDFERFLEIVDCHLNLLDPRCEVLELIESHDRAIDHLLEGVSLLDEQAHITIALAHLLLEHLGPALNLIPIDRVIVLNLLAFFLEAGLELIHIPIDPVLHPRLIGLDIGVLRKLLVLELGDGVIDVAELLPEFVVEELVGDLDQVGAGDVGLLQGVRCVEQQPLFSLELPLALL